MEAKAVVVALAALAQETRLAIYRLLVQTGPEGIPAGRVSDLLSVAPTTLSFHLKELAHAGLVRARPEGRFIFYSADFERMVGLVGFLTENCCRESGAACLPASCSSPPSSPARRSHETLSRARRRL